MNDQRTPWDEHQQHPEHESLDPLNGPDDVLSTTYEEVEVEDVPKKRTGVNPRLLAVVMMIVVIGAAGFAFLKMKSGRASIEEPLNQNIASTEPVQQTPAGTGMLGMPAGASSQSHDLLGGEAPSAAPVQPPTFVPDASPVSPSGVAQQPLQPANQGAQIAAAPAAVAVPPPASDAAQSQLTAMVAQLESMQTEATRLRTENAQLQQQLKAAEDKKKESRQRSVTADKVGERHVVAKQAPGKVTAKASKKGGRIPDEEIVTEGRESRFASMTVRAIYPLNGRDARAWVNVGNDLVEVSAGSTINGAMVKRVSPEAMEVITDAGVIRAQR